MMLEVSGGVLSRSFAAVARAQGRTHVVASSSFSSYYVRC